MEDLELVDPNPEARIPKVYYSSSYTLLGLFFFPSALVF